MVFLFGTRIFPPNDAIVLGDITLKFFYNSLFSYTKTNLFVSIKCNFCNTTIIAK